MYKPVEGVQYTKYTRHGIKVTAENEQYIASDNTQGFEFVSASGEQLEKALAIQRKLQPGRKKDVDKKIEDMDDEEKAVFDCLEDEENVFANAYDELEDDFILMMNDGKPALELIDKIPIDLDKPLGENEGIIVV